MQNQTNKKKKKGMKPVYLPYLRGNVWSRTAVKRGFKVMGFVVMFVFIYLLLGGAMTFENTILRVYDMQGQLLQTAEGDRLTVSSLSTGTYLLQIGTQVVRFIKR